VCIMAMVYRDVCCNIVGTKRTPIPWRARTVHSVLGSKDTNEKLELEVSSFVTAHATNASFDSFLSEWLRKTYLLPTL
jgi:hypothetical protein